MSIHRSFLTGFPASPNLWGCKEKPKHQTYVSFGLCCAVQRPTPPTLVAPQSHASLFPFWFLPCHPHTSPSSSHMSIPSFCCVHTFQVPFPECFYCIGKDKIGLSCGGGGLLKFMMEGPLFTPVPSPKGPEERLVSPTISTYWEYNL